MEQPWAKYKVQFKVQELHFESLKETYQNTRHQSKPVISCGDSCLTFQGAKGPVNLCSVRTEVERRMVNSRKVKVDFSLEDMDLSEFKGKATYE